jgi:hypothetical protein
MVADCYFVWHTLRPLSEPVQQQLFSSLPVGSNMLESMKQPEYTEGPRALENFKRLATAILQAPAKKKKRQTNCGT